LFPIHGRNLVIERLYFHLPGEQSVYFNDNDHIEDIIGKAIVVESMFTGDEGLSCFLLEL